ncbi:uncharacterized protein F5Z01DRAFT_649784 [Emericellopsis atlantica]|uniref:Uncharacterized protein n=1 Tax=Emericellopsis atlantica TaxID=2614577 RepID=A0A9P8CR30_9HYPO|nr:uncharacterized protein F5Z01DRAFT_649784 [Emericellopsis atlantica]KAG9256288.1 hypothetical protein F5Z01DRAFT_649784 [Emericellopsis atlantica]
MVMVLAGQSRGGVPAAYLAFAMLFRTGYSRYLAKRSAGGFWCLTRSQRGLREADRGDSATGGDVARLEREE